MGGPASGGIGVFGYDALSPSSVRTLEQPGAQASHADRANPLEAIASLMIENLCSGTDVRDFI